MTETIARFCAVMWSEDPSIRERIFRTMKDMYQLRSLIVHSGSRVATGTASNDAQKVAETLVGLVLGKCDLNQTHDEFSRDLRKATHGGVWKPR